MKHIWIILSYCMTLWLFTSCRTLTTYYEICNVSSNLVKDEAGQFEYLGDGCTITYNFWSNGGDAGFVVTNESDEIVYIDLAKSFFIRNGVAYDYFLGRTTTSLSTFIDSSSYSATATAYGYWRNLNNYVPGAITAQKGAANSQSNSKGVSYYEKDVIALPPHSSKSISEYSISTNVFYDCEYNITPNNKETPSYSFSYDQSPIVFTNYITYRVGEDSAPKTISNTFYIDTISFLTELAAKKIVKSGCPDDRTEKSVFTVSAPDRFYIKYQKNSGPDLTRPKGPKGNVKDIYD